MSAFLSALSQIGDFFFQVLTMIFNVYTGTFLICVLGLWVLRKVVRLIKAIT